MHRIHVAQYSLLWGAGSLLMIALSQQVLVIEEKEDFLCFVGTSQWDLSLNCSDVNNTVIQVAEANITYGYEVTNLTANCTGQCCQSPGDCLVPVSEYANQNVSQIIESCNGQQSCDVQIYWQGPPPVGSCNFVALSTDYIVISYQCVIILAPTTETPSTKMETTSVLLEETSKLISTSTPETTSKVTSLSTPETTSKVTSLSTPETTSKVTSLSTPETTSKVTSLSTPETTSKVTSASTPPITSKVTSPSISETTSKVTSTNTPEITSKMTSASTPEITHTKTQSEEPSKVTSGNTPQTTKLQTPSVFPQTISSVSTGAESSSLKITTTSLETTAPSTAATSERSTKAPPVAVGTTTEPSSSLGLGVILGIVAAGVVIVALIALTIWLCTRNRRGSMYLNQSYNTKSGRPTNGFVDRPSGVENPLPLESLPTNLLNVTDLDIKKIQLEEDKHELFWE